MGGDGRLMGAFFKKFQTGTGITGTTSTVVIVGILVHNICGIIYAHLLAMES